jgi:hopanoid biosynthesis associated RND transporter like protein HpnN
LNLVVATRERLPKLVGFCASRRLLVMALAAMLALLSLAAARTWLGVTTDTGGMFASSLKWKQGADALAAAFPQNDALIVGVIDARIPEEAEATAAALADILRRDRKHFSSVSTPDALPYLQQNAFLLIGKQDLQDLLDRTIDAQPFLGQLAADPTMRGLFSALSLVAEGEKRGVANAAGFAPALGRFHVALAAAAAGHPGPLSWETLLAGKLAEQAGKYRFVLAKPVLDYGSLQPGGAAAKAVRQAASRLPFIADGQARLRLTGSVSLDDEEFATVAKGAVVGLAGSLVLVILWLYFAVRSWRLIVPILTTLILGLVFTTGFASVAVGTLNLISVAFAILFVGIAVDFAIQFCVRLRARRYNHPGLEDALRETGRRAGAQILVAALATASGFLAFTPTAFVGVAQLGIIAGGGMVIAFMCTLTILPAMLRLCEPRRDGREASLALLMIAEPLVVHHKRAVVGAFAAFALAGAALTPTLAFDGDPLHTKNQHTEAVVTLYDLMDDPLTNPYTSEAILPSLDAAKAIIPRLEKLPLVQDVLSLASFIPEDQGEKLAIIGDAAGILDPTLDVSASGAPVTAADLRQAAAKLDTTLQKLRPILNPGDALLAIAGDVNLLAHASDATLLAANEALVRFLPQQLDRLRLALSATAVTRADLPPSLARDWMLPDGRARIQVLPKASVKDAASIRRFAASVVSVMPEANGSAVWIMNSTRTIIGAFRLAALSAFVAIAIILAVALRRALDVALVLTPLLVSALLTVLLLKAFGLSLNFANIIALPLLLGVGVSFNIYFIMNWRAGNKRFLGSATARAVLFSALTTGTAFGSLALSQHPGTASMGTLLLMSLACTVVTTLVFVPALLAMVPKPHVALGGTAL